MQDPDWKKFGSRIWDGKNSDPESGMEKIRILIPDKHPGSATLVFTLGGDSGVREAIQRSGRREEGIRVHQRHPALIQGSNSDQPEYGFLVPTGCAPNG